MDDKGTAIEIKKSAELVPESLYYRCDPGANRKGRIP